MTEAERPRFHLAFAVHDLEAARRFYVDLLGCRTGRQSKGWIDFDFRGHQLTAHLAQRSPAPEARSVDGDAVPVRHFGLILPASEWNALAERLRKAGVNFLIAPRLRFKGRPGEQSTLFLRDPSGNALEFKSFRDEAAIFAADPGVA